MWLYIPMWLYVHMRWQVYLRTSSTVFAAQWYTRGSMCPCASISCAHYPPPPLEYVFSSDIDQTSLSPFVIVTVAALGDAYVSPESVGKLQQRFEGSEMRYLTGGHVSSFLSHQQAFRIAIADSLRKL